MWLQMRCWLKAVRNSSTPATWAGPPGGPPVLLTQDVDRLIVLGKIGIHRFLQLAGTTEIRDDLAVFLPLARRQTLFSVAASLVSLRANSVTEAPISASCKAAAFPDTGRATAGKYPFSVQIEVHHCSMLEKMTGNKNDTGR
jgi:hypothetical protein